MFLNMPFKDTIFNLIYLIPYVFEFLIVNQKGLVTIHFKHKAGISRSTMCLMFVLD